NEGAAGPLERVGEDGETELGGIEVGQVDEHGGQVGGKVEEVAGPPAAVDHAAAEVRAVAERENVPADRAAAQVGRAGGAHDAEVFLPGGAVDVGNAGRRIFARVGVANRKGVIPRAQVDVQRVDVHVGDAHRPHAQAAKVGPGQHP